MVNIKPQRLLILEDSSMVKKGPVRESREEPLTRKKFIYYPSRIFSHIRVHREDLPRRMYDHELKMG